MFVYMFIHIFFANSVLQVDRGSSVKVKHYLYESRVIYTNFNMSDSYFRCCGRVGAVTMFGLCK